jgi:cytoplasmic iron level regulating protein YaaA (DUF328/UPF0246 family)
MSPDAIRELMSISPALAELNFERFQDWDPPFTSRNSRPALLAFNGDTYIGLNAAQSFSERDYTHAQKTLRILSGLYGVLRPLDLIQPYRLEIGSKLENPRGDNLYDFWGGTITDLLNADLAESPGAAALVNLASNEYFDSVEVDRVEGRIVTPSFYDRKPGGDYKMVSFFAKRARGAMASWIIRNRVKSVKALSGFDQDGYEYSAERSTIDRPVFLRSKSA